MYLRLRRQYRESCLLTQAESDSVPADLVAGTDNIFIHFPDHDALMLIDMVNSGWVPIYNCNLSEDIPGYIDAPATALSIRGRPTSWTPGKAWFARGHRTSPGLHRRHR